MARVCDVTGKKPMVGNNVSHANNKTKLLGRERKPLGSPARVGCCPAPDRQERYRCRARRPACTRPGL